MPRTDHRPPRRRPRWQRPPRTTIAEFADHHRTRRGGGRQHELGLAARRLGSTRIHRVGGDRSHARRHWPSVASRDDRRRGRTARHPTPDHAPDEACRPMSRWRSASSRSGWLHPRSPASPPRVPARAARRAPGPTIRVGVVVDDGTTSRVSTASPCRPGIATASSRPPAPR